MNCNPKIKDYFFDNFETILDELIILKDITLEISENNDDEFQEEIEHQSMDEFIRSICITCSSSLGLSYEEVYDCLENHLEELYYVFDR